jgi:hypothetical protein
MMGYTMYNKWLKDVPQLLLQKPLVVIPGGKQSSSLVLRLVEQL